MFVYIASVDAKNFSQERKMLTIEQIRERLADANIKRVAERAGVSPASAYRLLHGKSQPLYGTVKALSDYLSKAA